MITRPSGRSFDELRSIQFTRGFTKHAEGSVLVEYGETKVICTATVTEGVPKFIKDQYGNQGWLTAEYSMLPRATNQRSDREATRGKQGGRTLEIQRLIGRSLRAAVDLKKLGNHTIVIDCDVIQADGGTRTASITGACLALHDACQFLLAKGKIKEYPMIHRVAAVSVGIYQGTPILDLDYLEDFDAETDMNIVMNDNLRFIEIQGTAEGQTFSQHELFGMLELAELGLAQIFEKMQAALA